jgi:tRNA A-37 threonylcarbamoyl transferase component Bud32
MLHDAGMAHGDLHLGNVLFTDDGAVVLDLQHARRLRGDSDRERDLGELDFALWPLASVADRMRVQLAGLGLSRVAAGRDALRRIAAEARRRAARHGASRTRRTLRPGRRFAELALPEGRGLRLREVPQTLVEEALAAHSEAFGKGSAGDGGDERIWKDEGRSRISAVRAAGRDVVVKETRGDGGARRLADLWRGSAARRAWRAGHGLIAREIPAAEPLAFVEARSAGLPERSWLLLERLPGPDALTEARRAPEDTLDALLDVVTRLHARAVDHGDLKATNLVADGRGGLALVDLEQVRFPEALDEDRRIEGLAELNASLPDEIANAARRDRFDRYARRHPFDRGREAALREVVVRSRARRHRWTGQGCTSADPEP